MATEASYVITYVLAKHKNPYRDGKVFKEAFLEGSEKLFSNFKNKSEILNAIKDLQLSRRTVTRRIKDMNKNVTRQLEDDIQSCRFFSLQFDESTDIVDTAQLIVAQPKKLFGKISKAEIIAFLDTLREKHEQLEDPVWVKKLAFLKDFMGHYNSLNLQLQGKGKNIIELFSSVNALKAKLKLFASQLKRQNFKYFPYLEKHIKLTGECNTEMFCSELENFNQEFERRFANLNNLQPIFEFISFPFGEFDNEDISSNLAHTFQLNSSDLELEILTIQSDIILKARANENYFWNLSPEEKYPLLRLMAIRIFAFFGSTYLCEAAFSQMKNIKSQFRSSLTDDHLMASIRLCISDYKPNFTRLVEIECHASTSKN
ncbi:hypothetical protein ILUMI_11613 [Ignelater luminosus]|uniref:HAT C-terminal dimerisation domain-containing protein n=1 Tax=Ignelater luminosus TaxID=2038154 RepID=A0A8K0D4N3_IGNLU|nr:hypothetical protein ILUMI_11613 [Ignelater luminosus]